MPKRNQEVASPRLPAPAAPLPLACNLTDAAALIGLDYDTALKHRLFERWDDAGLIWTVPGTKIRRVWVDGLREWVTHSIAEQANNRS